MQYKYLLFDADNTLFDFNRCENEAFKLAIGSFNIEYTDEIYSEYHNINDGLWKALEKGLTTRDELKVLRYKLFLEKFGVSNVDFRDLALKYEELLGKQSFEIDGAYGLLKSLHGDFEIYVITNGITRIQNDRFSRSRLTQFIDKIYISEQMGVSKPSELFFDKVINDIGDEDREKYLVIGDSLTSDIDGAINAGLDNIWFNPKGDDASGRAPKYVINDLHEINSILSKVKNG